MWIAFAGLMFRGSAGFQLAFVLMVLFTSYVLQVQNRPYMSTAERTLVLKEHLRKAAEGDAYHRRMKPIMEAAIAVRDKHRANAAIKRKQNSLRRWGGSGVGSSRAKLGTKIEDNADYFWDYNTIEATLLACAVFVCLSGVMFESSQFVDRPDLVWMQDTIGTVVAIVLIYSAIYYLAVFVSEVSGHTPMWVKKCCANKKKGTFAEDDISDGAELGEIEFAEIRHELQTGVNDERTKMELAATAAELAKMANSNKQLVDMMRQQKKAGGAAGGGGMFMNPLAKKKRGKKIGKSSRSKKKEYAPRSVGKKTKGHVEDVSNPLTATSAEKTGLVRKTSFKKHKSLEGKTFYENTETGQTLWAVSGDAIVLEGRDAQASAITARSGNADGKPTHRVHKSGDGKEFYEHLGTGETTWKLPAGAVPVDAQSKKAAENEAIRQRRSSFKGRRMSAKQSFRVSDMDQFGKALGQDF